MALNKLEKCALGIFTVGMLTLGVGARYENKIVIYTGFSAMATTATYAMGKTIFGKDNKQCPWGNDCCQNKKHRE